MRNAAAPPHSPSDFGVTSEGRVTVNRSTASRSGAAAAADPSNSAARRRRPAAGAYGTGRLSAQRSTASTAPWWQSQQLTASERSPWPRILPGVIADPDKGAKGSDEGGGEDLGSPIAVSLPAPRRRLQSAARWGKPSDDAFLIGNSDGFSDEHDQRADSVRLASSLPGHHQLCSCQCFQIVRRRNCQGWTLLFALCPAAFISNRLKTGHRAATEQLLLGRARVPAVGDRIVQVADAVSVCPSRFNAGDRRRLRGRPDDHSLRQCRAGR